MAHTTTNDRARKSRIREREYRQQMMRLRKLDKITDEQLAVLKKIKAAEAKGKPVTVSSVADWHELRAMGAVKEQDGHLVLTSVGARAAAEAVK